LLQDINDYIQVQKYYRDTLIATHITDDLSPSTQVDPNLEFVPPTPTLNVWSSNDLILDDNDTGDDVIAGETGVVGISVINTDYVSSNSSWDAVNEQLDLLLYSKFT